MSVQETQGVIEAYLEALLGGGDFAAFFADDVVWTTTETGERLTGKDAVRDFIVAMHQQIFEAKPELNTTVAGDGVAALEATFVGTHRMELAGIPATGAQVRVPYSMFYDVADGRITALRAYLPMAVLMEQISSSAPATA